MKISKELTLPISFPSSPIMNSSNPNTKGDAFPRWKILDDDPWLTRNSMVFAMSTLEIMYIDFLPCNSEKIKLFFFLVRFNFF